MGEVQNDDYDAAADFARSIDECYRAIHERVAAGGPGWGGWPLLGGENKRQGPDLRGLAGGQARQRRSDPSATPSAQDRAAPLPAALHRRA